MNWSRSWGNDSLTEADPAIETAAKDEKSGVDVPPQWSVQPTKRANDLHT